jgi:hypothetical protein
MAKNLGASSNGEDLSGSGLAKPLSASFERVNQSFT